MKSFKKNPSYVSGQSTVVLMEIELQFFIYTLYLEAKTYRNMRIEFECLLITSDRKLQLQYLKTKILIRIQGVCEIKIVFIIILRHYLPFDFHKCSEFAGGYMTQHCNTLNEEANMTVHLFLPCIKKIYNRARQSCSLNVFYCQKGDFS